MDVKFRINNQRHVGNLAALLLTLSCATIPDCAVAQWPSHYLHPVVLGGGINARAGDVMATSNGGVIVTFDEAVNGVHTLKGQAYNDLGYELLENPNLYNEGVLWPVKAQLLPPHDLDVGFAIAEQCARSSLSSDEPTLIYQKTQLNGNFGFAMYPSGPLFEASAHSQLHNFLAYFNPSHTAIGAIVDDSFADTELSLAGDQAKQFSIVRTASFRALVSFTRYVSQAETPAEIWSYVIEPSATATPLHHLQRAETQLNEAQSKSQLLELAQNSVMLTWIGEQNGQTRLYEKLVDALGAEVSSARLIISDVKDYVVTTSSLGMPAFAAIQPQASVTPPTERLIAGLINPTTGDTLAIPIASTPRLKVKALRQEADGNFSLVYSLPENGTNILRVRRISGTTGATMWESTVADLGSASDAVIERYPNTFVDGNLNGDLFLLSRYDVPNTSSSEFHFVRLQSNGKLAFASLDAPGNLHTFIAAPGDVELVWEDRGQNETNYVVGRTLSDFAHIEILAILPADSSSYVDATAQHGQLYHYMVAAYNSSTGYYELSNQVDVDFRALASPQKSK